MDKEWFKNKKIPNLKQPKLLYLGRFRKEKGVYSLLKLFKQIKLKSVLTLAGDIIKLNNLSENIIIEIDISNKRKNELYMTSDLYIQPSYYEGFGNSVLEAMTYGTPCLVSANTAQPEVVLETGYIIKKITEIDIYKSILDYSAKSIDERKLMIDKVKNTVRENHSYDSRLRIYLNLINRDIT